MKEKTKETLKKIAAFACLCLYALGSIGGLGWSLYNKSYLIAVGVAVLAAMAVPTLLKALKVLTGEDF